ncbi:MBL fold metallo-hydrolase RNA specificity domain-containing protein [Vreelandella boliviensis]|uniref:MBL fold hydrolase n=1 Tax=Vreelandella boliviensis LC1 TaxID=1072583 RepID=A0A265DXE4_9GAMM|nr:MBL fold metallo-hydrolase [Halomonas boliviensis]EHJ93063.1 Ribonuclease [Halomonas boliviensis LC1]OZT73678.1 MBL fold hydrolase [Halomonas boliviensis LC1]
MQNQHTWPEIRHRGGASGVTGSCHQLIANSEHSLLVDCGLFQGEDAAVDSLAQLEVGFDISTLKALVITHVHIDHVGRIPYLLAAGYKGPILCSEPSALLLPLVIEDALKIGFTRNARLIEQFQAQLQKQLVPLAYDKWHSVVEDVALSMRVKLKRAGHILGSSYVEVALNDTLQGNKQRVVFSGDLGAANSPLLPAPKPPSKADVLVLESTYGNRQHEGRDKRATLLKWAIEQALENKGTVIIPAFSIGRTQELLYELEGVIHRAGNDSLWQSLEIIVDSPLAARFTRVYRDLKPFWDDEAQKRIKAGRHPLNFDALYTVDSHETHEQTVRYLAESGRPAVVIAASGMCAGGRVVNYLKAMLGDPRHQVLFVGYQGAGTPGRDIQRYGPQGGWVMLDGERYDIRAGVSTISGYSAHADQRDLLRFIKRMRHWPRKIRLVHGDDAAKQALKTAIEAMAVKYRRSVTVDLPENSS